MGIALLSTSHARLKKGRNEVFTVSIKSLRERMNKVLSEHPPSADGIQLLMVDTRIAMEDLGEYRSYPTIGMYGNWCVHSRLDKSTMYYDIISAVQMAYENCKAEERGELKTLGLNPGETEAKNEPISGNPINRLFLNIKNCFHLDELRNELSTFYSAHEVNPWIIEDDHSWQQFRFLLLLCLVDRPLEVPEGKKAYDKLRERSESEGFAPTSLSLERRTSKEHPNTIELWWVIGMNSPRQVKGELCRATMP